MCKDIGIDIDVNFREMKTYVYTKTCTWIFITIKICKQFKRAQVSEQVKYNVVSLDKGMLFSHNNNKVMTHATTCMNLKNIMLSERSQEQRTDCCMIPSIWHTRIQKSMQIWVAQDWTKGKSKADD